jgi:hypothetical protein
MATSNYHCNVFAQQCLLIIIFKLLQQHFNRALWLNTSDAQKIYILNFQPLLSDRRRKVRERAVSYHSIDCVAVGPLAVYELMPQHCLLLDDHCH